MFFGIETEYALSRAAGGTGELSVDAARLLTAVANAHPHLTARPGGVFLCSGRFYIDAGAHPEFAGPEIQTPLDAHRYVLAGDRILETALRDVAREHGPLLRLARSNVDYVSRTTWACHENYSFRCSPTNLPNNLIPHLVSRLCFSGSGGFDPFRPLRFVVSPRVCFLEKQLSGNSTADRGIFHLKDEPLATDGSRRMHVLSGESLCAGRAAMLRIGTTALVLALAEHGLNPGRPLTLRSPLEAMHAFNADPSFRVRAALSDGRSLTAVEMQRELLHAVEQRLGERFLPDRWPEEICHLWRGTLDGLEGDSASLDTELDWRIKRRLFAAHGQAKEASLESWPGWDARIAADPDALRALGLTRNEGLSPADGTCHLPPELARIRDLRCELFELDGRFSEFTATSRGIFRQLQDAGVLPKSSLTDQEIEQAVHLPPLSGRARLRGLLVHQLSRSSRFIADWGAIRDAGGRRLTLDGPACEAMPEWQSAPADDDDGPSSFPSFIAEGERLFNQGNYLGARSLLASALAESPVHLQASGSLLYLVGRVNCRAGYFREGLVALEALASRARPPLSTICNRMMAHRYEGLIAGPEMWSWIRRGRELLSTLGGPPASTEELVLFRQLWAHALIVAGRLLEAAEILEPLLRDESCRSCVHPRVWCRAMVDLAEAKRRLGLPQESRRLLQSAEEIQRDVGAVGDVADYTLRVRFKLEEDDEAARAAIQEAEAIHRRMRSPMGKARLLIVEARRFPNDAREKRSLRRLRGLTNRTPALQSCPLRQRIENEWDSVWCARQQPVDKSAEDFYWGL